MGPAAVFVHGRRRSIFTSDFRRLGKPTAEPHLVLTAGNKTMRCLNAKWKSVVPRGSRNPVGRKSAGAGSGRGTQKRSPARQARASNGTAVRGAVSGRGRRTSSGNALLRSAISSRRLRRRRRSGGRWFAQEATATHRARRGTALKKLGAGLAMNTCFAANTASDFSPEAGLRHDHSTSVAGLFRRPCGASNGTRRRVGTRYQVVVKFSAERGSVTRNSFRVPN